MTRLLVSVRNAQEAQAAHRGGAQLIDLKEPRQGSLGAVPPADWPSIQAALPSSVPLSVALGELHEPACAERARLAAGFQFAKVGLAHSRSWPDWLERWSAVIQALPPTVQPVAVAYADADRAAAPTRHQILTAAQQLRCAAVLVDTFDKTHGSLLDLWSLNELEHFCHDVQSAGLLCVLGGSLSLQQIPQLLPLNPDYIAVRGAVCEGDRTGPLRTELVAALAQLVGQQLTTNN
ncbi:MAG: (5-formylfuran-3-yl)methyl phosphate synthase [Planctomycetota bacterium]